MNKIIIVGTSGSGKTTFAQKLSRILDIPHFQLDGLYFKNNWQEKSDAEFFQAIEAAVDRPRWIIDGNYSRANKLTWNVADTVIWIDLSFPVTMYQIIMRSFKRAFYQKPIWDGLDNKESFKKLFSRDSIVLWSFNTYQNNKDRYSERMAAKEFQHINFVRLRTRSELKLFLAMVDTNRRKN